MSEQTDYHKFLKDADIGADCQEFLKSNVGQYLKTCAEEEEMSALRALGYVDPEAKAEIIRLQIKAAVPRRFIEFISRAIGAGKNAEFQLEQTRD